MCLLLPPNMVATERPGLLPHSLAISCQLASLLATILPIAAMIRKMSVSPPTRYHHRLLLIWGIHAYNKVSMIASRQEREPTTMHIHCCLTGTGRHRENARRF